MRILVVEDEHKIANSIKKGLEQETYAVDVAYDADEGLATALAENYDLIVLDRMLPGSMEGMDICKELRIKGLHLPIIMLTAKDQVGDRVAGLNSGADDYLIKPFSFEELLARIRALLRRPQVSSGTILNLGDLTLDPVNFKVERAGKKIALSKKEFALLEYLLRNPNKILSKDNIISHVWDFDADILPNTVEVYIGYLRSKIDQPFSIVLYRISSVELNRGLRRQGVFLNQPPPEDPLVFERFRQNQLAESRERLRQNIWLFNLAILLAGGAGSYWFARRSLKPIQDAMDVQSRFTADASHELRTPLAAMQTEIEVALRDPKLDQEMAVNILRSNLEEVAKLKSLSDGLLRLVRENGKSLPVESITLEKVTKEAINQVSSLANAKEITITNSVSDITVLGDEQNLVELTVILLDNAIKYSGPKTTIKLSAKKHGKYGYLTVADQGQGIKASDLPHIFDRFYRADSSRSKEKVAGYGLGLSIAKKIIDLHKGTIEVKSTPGKGSTFTVRLPLAQK